MAYIGNTAASRFVSNRAASVFSGDGSAVAFTLEQSVAQDEDILVSVDGVIQEPSVAYAVSSGTILTFTAAPSTNSGNNIFVYYLASQVGTVGHPSTQGLTATTGAFSSNATVAGTLGVTGVATGTIVKGTTSFQTPLIEFTDGDDAIAIADAGVITIKNTSSAITSEGGAVTTNIAQGLCKVWVSYFQGDNNNAAVLDDFNVSSQTDNSQGRTTTNFDNNFANDDYSFVGQVFDGGGANDIRLLNHDVDTDTYTSGAIKYYCLDGGSNLNDAQRFFAQLMGDLA